MIQLNLIPYQILGFILQKYFPDKKIGGGKCASGGACHVRGLVVSGGATRYFVVVALSSSVSIHTYTLQLISGTILATNMAATSFNIQSTKLQQAQFFFNAYVVIWYKTVEFEYNKKTDSQIHTNQLLNYYRTHYVRFSQFY